LWYDGSSYDEIDINSGAASSFPSDFTVYNGKLFFQADGGTNGKEMWWYDGTSYDEIDIRSGTDGSDPADFTVYENSLYFRANTDTNGFELWVFND
jgi:ELWxxDGT repeat protein